MIYLLVTLEFYTKFKCISIPTTIFNMLSRLVYWKKTKGTNMYQKGTS